MALKAPRTQAAFDIHGGALVSSFLGTLALVLAVSLGRGGSKGASPAPQIEVVPMKNLLDKLGTCGGFPGIAALHMARSEVRFIGEIVPYGGDGFARLESQIGTSSRKWTRKKIAYITSGISVFIFTLIAAFIIGIKVIGPKFAPPTPTLGLLNVTQTVQWHAVTSMVMLSASATATPSPSGDNSGGPDGGCDVRGIYTGEELCKAWCKLPQGMEKVVCKEFSDQGVWKYFGCPIA
ncbi:hypothetical protein K458DRAFT_407863 [Lentithecium fluviatile CBS 122367]|uniref:Uncharacterized protein n=1 Tax=Lentithecium fluviatile CBS 122367 TaxID=1168545 RepID=A0A6G1INT3_9PLEO|nr:hypothetical protein K458DRAFT_407863 [Lentithecium fluviatile CBS 122367]